MGKKRIIQKGGEAAQTAAAIETKPSGTKTVRRVDAGIAHIQATYNNTIITISDLGGKVLAWSSAGAAGFSGTKKATPYAAARVAEAAAEKARRIGILGVAVRVSGVGAGRDSAIRALANHGLNITAIKDITPLPHNGPRPPKARRV